MAREAFLCRPRLSFPGEERVPPRLPRWAAPVPALPPHRSSSVSLSLSLSLSPPLSLSLSLSRCWKAPRIIPRRSHPLRTQLSALPGSTEAAAPRGRATRVLPLVERSRAVAPSGDGALSRPPRGEARDPRRFVRQTHPTPPPDDDTHRPPLPLALRPFGFPSTCTNEHTSTPATRRQHCQLRPSRSNPAARRNAARRGADASRR